MAFQSSAFQPPPKPSRSEKIKGFGRAVRTFVLPAKGVPLLEESAWQRGKREGSELANSRAIQFMIVCAPIFAVGGLFFALPGFWWPLRVLLAALIGLGVAVVAAFVVAGYYALRAPYGQRDEARNYAQALETHARNYAQWARRREIAYDFRHDGLQDAARLSAEAPQLMGSITHEENRWRTILTNIAAQIEANGGDASAFMEAQLAFLDDSDALRDAFGGDKIALIRNSMLQACQNLLAEVRQEGPPPAPVPPRGSDQ